jgi:hypothetical protein
MASKILINDLIASKIITSGNQLLRREKLLFASVYKTMELIFTPLGEDYLEDKKTAVANYSQAKSMDIYDVDKNADGILDPKETSTRTGRLLR